MHNGTTARDRNTTGSDQGALRIGFGVAEGVILATSWICTYLYFPFNYITLVDIVLRQ